MLIDAIQYAPQVLPHVTMAVDRTKKPAGFWLTGSQPFHLMKGVSESLAAMFETWVVAEILKSYRHNGLQAPLFHYRDRDGREVDLLVVRDGVIHPVEIKKSAAPRCPHTSSDAVTLENVIDNQHDPS